MVIAAMFLSVVSCPWDTCAGWRVHFIVTECKMATVAIHKQSKGTSFSACMLTLNKLL